LADGSVHRVLKNFPDESRLRELLQGQATAVSYRMLDQFWLLSYETVGRA
jgi:demethylmenaquinone methyltransferase/2-methoxy-6-polyprenyl-1,4-benzoquinol methylase